MSKRPRILRPPVSSHRQRQGFIPARSGGSKLRTLALLMGLIGVSWCIERVSPYWSGVFFVPLGALYGAYVQHKLSEQERWSRIWLGVKGGGIGALIGAMLSGIGFSLGAPRRYLLMLLEYPGEVVAMMFQVAWVSVLKGMGIGGVLCLVVKVTRGLRDFFWPVSRTWMFGLTAVVLTGTGFVAGPFIRPQFDAEVPGSLRAMMGERFEDFKDWLREGVENADVREE